jgi:hypothetical protein
MLGCVAEKTSSSPSGRHVGHYLAFIDLKDELSVLLAAVHAAMMSIPLAEVSALNDGDRQST